MTIRRSPPAVSPAADPALDFAPIVRDKQRADGWTPDRQRAFIEALARLGTVKAAAAHIGMSAVGAYYLRRQPGAESFARAWARAHTVGVRALRDIAYERAVAGTPRGIWYQGERVGEERRYNDRLLMFLLRHEQPAIYGDPSHAGGGTKHPDTLAREARWAEAEDAVFVKAEEDDPDDDPIARRASAALWVYTMKVGDERRARVEGDVVTADFLLRQLAALEVMIESGEVDGERSSDQMEAKLEQFARDNLYRDPALSRYLDEVRREGWALVGEPEGPPLTFPLEPPRYTLDGPHSAERRAANKEAQALLARGQALWEAAATEEGWEAWIARERRDGEPPAPLP